MSGIEPAVTSTGEIAVGQARTRAEQIRDLTMLVVLTLWIAFGVAFVVQLFTNGAKAIDGLPPFWFWGLPLAPYSALYTPWARQGQPAVEAAPPEPPPTPPAPETTP